MERNKYRKKKEVLAQAKAQGVKSSFAQVRPLRAIRPYLRRVVIE